MYLTFVIRNGVGENYYVVASSPTEARDKLEGFFHDAEEIQVLSRSLVKLADGIYGQAQIT